ncbi:hypothetical protein [Rickettsiella massiliensis]|uniref:hypothetical protein n=1 Tax=Rickettsiella massiliensis TaxID=676517 RepID=UPI00029A485D|nr:hypothetical protein [Rickettsiella massiliensis]
MALKEPTVERYGTIGQIDDKFIRCYLSHRAGVFCIKVSKLKNVKSSYHQQYHPSRVGDNTTLFSLDNNAALGGGDIAGWTSGKAFSASGVNYESWVCLGPSEVIDCGCDNPIVDYFKENDELVVICSGRETKIDEEEITPDKKGKGKIIIEEENLIEVNVSNTVVKTANIQYEQPTFKNKKFSYLSFLSPKKKERSIITYKTREDYNDFCHVNALTHMSCRYNDELFIFPRDIFQNPEHDKFFSFNRTKKKVNSYFIPEKIRESVQKNNMMFYDQVQVASTQKNLIYFSLNKYNQKTKKLSTQIFELEVDANQEN